MRETKVNFDGHYPCATRSAEKEYGLVPDVSFDKYYRRFHLMPLIRRLCNAGFIYAFAHTARNTKFASYVKREIHLYYLYCTECSEMLQNCGERKEDDPLSYDKN